ncbi:MAG: hypothetical protein ABTQ32_19655 [Myxococcaceae bacterium]
MSFRVRILCEDRTAERFLRRLCERHHVHVLEVLAAPAGEGNASAWVLRQYARLVQQRRSKRFQANLGLVVHIDGDQKGVKARKAELESELGAAPRQPDEAVAVCVPTWCIETWLLHLTQTGQPGEDVQVKNDPSWAHALSKISDGKAFVLAAAQWSVLQDAPPSLVDGRDELRRVFAK